MTKEPSLRSRFILFPLVALVFILLCGFLAISAFGYNLKYVNGRFVTERNGMIILATRPGDAKIYVDGKLYKNRTSYINILTTNINRLSIGEHTVKIEKDGYETWEGVFNVEPSVVAWGNYILLIPQKRETTPFNLPGNIVQTINTANQTKILCLVENKDSGIFSIWEINTATKEKTRIFETKIVAGQTYRAMEYSSSNQRILIEKKVGDTKTHQIIEARENGQSWNVEELFQMSFDTLVFNPRNHDSLYVLKEKNLYSIDYPGKNMSAVLATNVLNLFPDSGSLYFVQNVEGSYGLWRLEQNNTKTNIVKTLPVSESYQIQYLSEVDSYAILSKKDKDLFLYTIVSGNPVLSRIADQVDWFSASPKARYLGYYREGSFICYNPEKSKYYTSLSAREISSVSWLSDESNIIYVEKESLGLVNFNGFYDKVLFKAEKSIPVYTSLDANNIFYSDISPEKNFLDLYSTSL
jgi:hypothetical protein